MTDEIPAAALRRADEVMNPERRLISIGPITLDYIRKNVALYIAQHETFPDPDLEITREIVAKVYDDDGWDAAFGKAIRDGKCDDCKELQAALACFKAGREAERNGR